EQTGTLEEKDFNKLFSFLHFLLWGFFDLVSRTCSPDTSSSIIEWAMAELLYNPAILRQRWTADRRLEEPDIRRLPYVQAICKETLRKAPLHRELAKMETIPSGTFVARLQTQSSFVSKGLYYAEN
ncbi:hypothetical protein EJ110_NYTH08309, partial [Nymphaea thermarum]